MTREEAIEIIKRNCTSDSDLRKACKLFIPELTESEDEKMLREIKRYIKEQGNKPTGLPNGTVAVYDMIDWLEKQKDSLHIEKTCKDNIDTFTDEDEKAIKSMTRLIKAFYDCNFPTPEGFERKDLLTWLKKQKDASKAIEAVERIDKYIDRYLANAHDMDDSNPYKKYYRGWDDALGKMAGILQDVYSEAEQKEQTSDIILKAFENSKTDYSLEEREEASDYSEKVLPTSIACGESEEEYLLHKVIEAAYIAGQKEQKPPITGNDFGWIDELKHDLEHPEELDQKVDDVLKQRNGTRALEWSEEDELNCNRIIRFLEPHKTFFPMKETKEEMQNWLKNRLKSLRSKTNKKIYEVAKHELAIRFMNYLDENRPEGKMCLSNSECEDIDKAFKEIDWKKIMQYAKKYLFH